MKYFIDLGYGEIKEVSTDFKREIEAAFLCDLVDNIAKSLTLQLRAYDERATKLRGNKNPDWSDFFNGVDSLKNGKTWFERSKAWNPSFWMVLGDNGVLLTKARPCNEQAAKHYLPIFNTYAKVRRAQDVLAEIVFQLNQNATSIPNEKITKQTIQPQETNPMKDLFASMLNANKDAVKLAGKLSVGKAANEVINRKLSKSLPWYAKLFGQHKEVINNPLTKIATAQLVTAAAMHFAPGNEKIRYVADAMLQEAMVDVATNSEVLKGLISELEGLAGALAFESTGKAE